MVSDLPIELEALRARSEADPDLPPVFLGSHLTVEYRLDARVVVNARSVDHVVAMVRERLAVEGGHGVERAGWRHHTAVETAHEESRLPGAARVFRRHVWETAPPDARVELLPPDPALAVRLMRSEPGADRGVRELPLRRAVWGGRIMRAAYDEETNTVFVTP